MATMKNESAAKPVSPLSGIVGALPEEMQETAEALETIASEGFDQARKFIRENPLATVAVGFGIGVLIGAWLRRD